MDPNTMPFPAHVHINPYFKRASEPPLTRIARQTPSLCVPSLLRSRSLYRRALL